MSYGMADAKDLLLYMDWHDASLRQIEAQPESRAFIKGNWENRGEFEAVQNGVQTYFLEDNLARDFSEYLGHLHVRDKIAGQLLKRFQAAQDPIGRLRTSKRAYCK